MEQHIRRFLHSWWSYQVEAESACSKVISFELMSIIQTLPKAQRTRGLSSSYQSNFLRSYHKFEHNSWSNFIFRISTKNQLLNQTTASPINLKFNINFNFITSKKHQRQNAEQTPASKSCLNFNFKILTNPCAQSLNKSLAIWPFDQTSAFRYATYCCQHDPHHQHRQQ